MNLKLEPHEVDALRNLIACGRAFATILKDPNDQYVRKLKAWTGIVEKAMERGDGHHVD